jgi:hypothetical protein
LQSLKVDLAGVLGLGSDHDRVDSVMRLSAASPDVANDNLEAVSP